MRRGRDAVESALLYLADRPESGVDEATGWPGQSAPRTVTIANARTLDEP
jgi:hypothetical protein